MKVVWEGPMYTHNIFCTFECLWNWAKVKIVVSIHSTLLRNFHFLHSYRILHCLKTIAKYRNVNACLFALCLHAYTYCSRSWKIVVSIHWTLLSNFHFLHHPQILHCLKAIEKYRNMHAHLCTWSSYACTYTSGISKIIVSIHLNLLRNVHIFHHS